MNLKSIKEILDNNLIDDDSKQDLVMAEISKDKNVLPRILEILEFERDRSKKVIQDMNLELSRAHIYIEGYPESKKESKQDFNKAFVVDNIAEFYVKYKGVVMHCFNRFN